MNCAEVELRLSGYMEAGLPAEEAGRVKQHLEGCANCSALLREMESAVSLCRSYSVLEPDLRLIENILLRTSGRPRTRPFKELFHQYFIRPLLTPRLAVGAALAILFAALMLDVLLPRLSVTMSSFSPAGIVRLMDRSAQQLYGEGLRAYNKKNEWQAQFDRFKSNTMNNLRSIMERMDVPVQGRKKPQEQAPRRETPPKEKSSSLFLLPV